MAEQETRKKQDELSLAEVVRSMHKWTRYLMSHWVVIVFAGLICGVSGLTYAVLKKPLFSANYSFVLEEDTATPLGGASGLASLIGVDLGAMAGSNPLFKGENIFELYRSRRMITKTLLTQVEFKPGKRELLVDRYISSQGLRDAWRDDPVLSRLNFNIPQNQFTVVHDSILTQFVDEINESQLGVQKPDKKLSIVQISMESGDQLFAKEFVNHLVENVNAFYVYTKTKKASASVNSLKRNVDSVKRVLMASLGSAASAQERDPNPNEVLKRLVVPVQRRQIDVEASNTIYQEFVKNYELSKMTLDKQMPLIQAIDTPVLPLKKIKPRKLYYLAGFGFLGAFLTGLFLVVKKIWDDEIMAGV